MSQCSIYLDPDDDFDDEVLSGDMAKQLRSMGLGSDWTVRVRRDARLVNREHRLIVLDGGKMEA